MHLAEAQIAQILPGHTAAVEIRREQSAGHDWVGVRVGCPRVGPPHRRRRSDEVVIMKGHHLHVVRGTIPPLLLGFLNTHTMARTALLFACPIHTTSSFVSTFAPYVRVPTGHRVPRPARTAMTVPRWSVERNVAVRAVAEAGVLARKVQSTARSVVKADSSPVTVADFGVQAYIISKLHKAFPDAKFIAEETTDALSDPKLLDAVLAAVNGAGAEMTREELLNTIDLCGYEGSDPNQRTFILDPIDGTKGFLAGRQYCVALAMTEGGRPVLGVLGCPNLSLDGVQPGDNPGVVFHAILNQGTYMMDDEAAKQIEVSIGKRVRASDEQNPIRAQLAESVEKAHSSHELSARVSKVLGTNVAPMRMDSQAKYGCMSRGDAHFFLRFPRAGYVERVWDHAAGVVVIEEAGGKVTDGRGRPLDFSHGRYLDNDDGIVASSSEVMHGKVIAAVQQAIAESKSVV